VGPEKPMTTQDLQMVTLALTEQSCIFPVEPLLISAQLADYLRCDFLPECHMASAEIHERRRPLRYRNVLIGQWAKSRTTRATSFAPCLPAPEVRW
jgi:hypothetical protein